MPLSHVFPTDTQKWSKIILRDTFYLWGCSKDRQNCQSSFLSVSPHIHLSTQTFILPSDAQTNLAQCERDHTGCEYQQVGSVGPSFSLFTTLTKVTTKDLLLAQNSRHLTVLFKYYGLHVCVLPKFICWSPNPHCDNIRRWDLWEVNISWGWSPHDGISALIRRDVRELASSLSLPYEDITRKSVLTRNWIGWHFNLGLPSLQNCEKYISVV